MARKREGKPYIWVTWLSKLLGGQRCVWSAWFKAHYKYAKYETMAADLDEWNKQHAAMMVARRVELEEAGWTVFAEEENEFRLEGKVATVAGKPDLIAKLYDRVRVIDGKTGRRRDSDVWQVLIYLFALVRARKDLNVTQMDGEVHYKMGDVRMPVPWTQLTADAERQIVELIRRVGGDEAPPRHPSREECRMCNIGPADCPDRDTPIRSVETRDF